MHSWEWSREQGGGRQTKQGGKKEAEPQQDLAGLRHFQRDAHEADIDKERREGDKCIGVIRAHFLMCSGEDRRSMTIVGVGASIHSFLVLAVIAASDR